MCKNIFARSKAKALEYRGGYFGEMAVIGLDM